MKEVLKSKQWNIFLMEHIGEKMDHLIEGILTYSKIDKEI
jgi:hypothetical protein